MPRARPQSAALRPRRALADRSAGLRTTGRPSNVTYSVTAIPMAVPTSASFSPWPITSRSTSPPCAPRAMRIPNSWERWPAEYATTPYKPTAASSSARPARSSNRRRFSRRGATAPSLLFSGGEPFYADLVTLLITMLPIWWALWGLWRLRWGGGTIGRGLRLESAGRAAEAEQCYRKVGSVPGFRKGRFHLGREEVGRTRHGRWVENAHSLSLVSAIIFSKFASAVALPCLIKRPMCGSQRRFAASTVG